MQSTVKFAQLTGTEGKIQWNPILKNPKIGFISTKNKKKLIKGVKVFHPFFLKKIRLNNSKNFPNFGSREEPFVLTAKYYLELRNPAGKKHVLKEAFAFFPALNLQ